MSYAWKMHALFSLGTILSLGAWLIFGQSQKTQLQLFLYLNVNAQKKFFLINITTNKSRLQWKAWKYFN